MGIGDRGSIQPFVRRRLKTCLAGINAVARYHTKANSIFLALDRESVRVRTFPGLPANPIRTPPSLIRSRPDHLTGAFPDPERNTLKPPTGLVIPFGRVARCGGESSMEDRPTACLESMHRRVHGTSRRALFRCPFDRQRRPGASRPDDRKPVNDIGPALLGVFVRRQDVQSIRRSMAYRSRKDEGRTGEVRVSFIFHPFEGAGSITIKSSGHLPPEKPSEGQEARYADSQHRPGGRLGH
jgi:hypothetical protein